MGLLVPLVSSRVERSAAEGAAQATRIGSPVLGVVIPAIVFGISFVLTWLLYRHFARRPPP